MDSECGKRKTMLDGTGMTRNLYDNLDRLWQKAPFGTLTYQYDENGNLARMRSSNPGGIDVACTWDHINRLKLVQPDPGQAAGSERKAKWIGQNPKPSYGLHGVPSKQVSVLVLCQSSLLTL